jgi:hypothetical protein
MAGIALIQIVVVQCAKRELTWADHAPHAAVRLPAIVSALLRRQHRESTMSDSARDKKDSASDKAKRVQVHEDDRMEDEEKIMAGRHDVNYPAHLTKDVPGG